MAVYRQVDDVQVAAQRDQRSWRTRWCCLADPVIPTDVFRAQPVLVGPRVRLEPLTEAVLDEYLCALADPEVRRLTASSTASKYLTAKMRESSPSRHDRTGWRSCCRTALAMAAQWILLR